MNLNQAREFFGVDKGVGRTLIFVRGQPDFCCLVEDADGEAVVYGVKDWDRNYSPTWGFDSDGELREFNADGAFCGPPLAWKKIDAPVIRAVRDSAANA